MSGDAYLPMLRVVRRPGASGPVLSVAGALTGATVTTLQEELQLLAALGYPALTVDLSACRFGDPDGLLTFLETLGRLGQEGCRLVVVTGTDWMTRLMAVARIDQLLPVYTTGEEAERMLRLAGPPPPAPTTWDETRDATIAQWQGFRKRLDVAPTVELLRDLTTMTALCEHAEEIYQQRTIPAVWRCQFCPLFQALGGRPHDVGCRSVLDPIISALRAGDRVTAGAELDALLYLLQKMPLPAREAVAYPK
jgi:anti-anti-sigma factor